MRIARHFTTAGTDPYATIEFEQRESRIVNPDGSVVFEAADIFMPKGWSQVAVDIMAQKYFRKAGVPAVLRPIAEDGVPEWLWRMEGEPTSEETVGERDSRQIFRRLAGTWTYWAWKQRYFDSEADAQAEGIFPCPPQGRDPCPVDELERPYACGFAQLWNSLHAKTSHGWDAKDWVWVYDFRRVA